MTKNPKALGEELWKTKVEKVVNISVSDLDLMGSQFGYNHAEFGIVYTHLRITCISAHERS
jgi:hypothetical protein